MFVWTVAERIREETLANNIEKAINTSKIRQQRPFRISCTTTGKCS
jgi:hypothetical protein